MEALWLFHFLATVALWCLTSLLLEPKDCINGRQLRGKCTSLGATTDT